MDNVTNLEERKVESKERDQVRRHCKHLLLCMHHPSCDSTLIPKSHIQEVKTGGGSTTYMNMYLFFKNTILALLNAKKVVLPIVEAV